MQIGLYDADGHNFPSLPLMKISAYHKAKGDSVEFAVPLCRYDKVYISRVFGDEYTNFADLCFQANEIVYGGTGFAIRVENGREIESLRRRMEILAKAVIDSVEGKTTKAKKEAKEEALELANDWFC